MHVPISGPLSLILETAFLSGYLGGEFCEWDLDDPEIKTLLIFTHNCVVTHLYSFILFH